MENIEFRAKAGQFREGTGPPFHGFPYSASWGCNEALRQDAMQCFVRVSGSAASERQEVQRSGVKGYYFSHNCIYKNNHPLVYVKNFSLYLWSNSILEKHTNWHKPSGSSFSREETNQQMVYEQFPSGLANACEDVKIAESCCRWFVENGIIRLWAQSNDVICYWPVFDFGA